MGATKKISKAVTDVSMKSDACEPKSKLLDVHHKLIQGLGKHIDDVLENLLVGKVCSDL